MALYINYYFKELKLEGTMVQGIFDAPDSEAYCNFRYDLETRKYEIWNCNKSEDELLPLPFYWLNMKFEENGYLRSCESKISY